MNAEENAQVNRHGGPQKELAAVTPNSLLIVRDYVTGALLVRARDLRQFSKLGLSGDGEWHQAVEWMMCWW